MVRPLEQETVLRETWLAYPRMIQHTDVISQRGFSNRLLDGLSTLGKENLPEAFNKGAAMFAIQTIAMTKTKLPEMVLLHRRATKGRLIPENPNIFFDAIKGSNEFNFRTANLRRQEVEQTHTFFKELQVALGGDTPALWTLVPVSDALLKGLKVRDYNSLAEETKKWCAPVSKQIRVSMLFGNFLYHVLKEYLEPESLAILVESLREDRRKIQTYGLELPTLELEDIQP